MAHSTRTLRIVLASVIAVLMVGSAYVFSGPNPFFGLGRIAEAQSSEELLKEYAAKDSDTDGLPDWQEALYGTDPLNAESFKAGTKDGDAVAQGLVEPKVAVRPEEEPTDLSSIPGTLPAANSVTDRFAQTLLKKYLLGRGETPPTSAEIVAFVTASIDDLANESTSPVTFKPSDVRAGSGTGTAAMTTYAAQMEAAFAANTVPADRNELSYFADAVKGDDSALKKIGDISKAYKNIASAIMKIQVPAEARQAHLAIANALMHMSETSGDMSMMETDPVRALMGIGLYERYANEVVAAFTNLSGIFVAQQVSIPSGTEGYFIVKTAADAAASK